MENEKLIEISSRIKKARNELIVASIPKKNSNSALGVFITILAIPILMMLFMGSLVFAIWLIMNPLTTTSMYGISIALIGWYAVFLNPKRGK